LVISRYFSNNHSKKLCVSAVKIYSVKKNVLQFIGSFRQGGSERQAVQLSQLLHDDGNFRVFVACLDAEGSLRQEIE